jgi:hypothetical protein
MFLSETTNSGVRLAASHGARGFVGSSRARLGIRIADLQRVFLDLGGYLDPAGQAVAVYAVLEQV